MATDEALFPYSQKKRILIVNKSFETGGIQSSMVNMANILCEYYDVDLFIYYPFGTMRSRVNPQVNIILPDWHISVLGMTGKEAFKTRNIKFIVSKVLGSIWAKCFGNQIPIKFAFSHQEKLKGYDLAIAYHQEQRRTALTSGFAKFINSRVESRKKVAWFHFDPSQVDLKIQYCINDYLKMDSIVCVSKSIGEKAKEAFPQLKNKIDYCYNFIDIETINRMSRMQPPFALDNDKFICFSACRLTKEKALVRAVNSLASVFKKFSDVIWYIAGDGIEYDNILTAINDNNVGDQIKLIGNQSNPYPFMKRADLIMNLSYHEAAPMVFLESLLLGTPVFATETSSVREFAEYGSLIKICSNNEQSITQGFTDLLEQRMNLKESRPVFDYTLNNNSLRKIMTFINDESESPL